MLAILTISSGPSWGGIRVLRTGPGPDGGFHWQAPCHAAMGGSTAARFRWVGCGPCCSPAALAPLSRTLRGEANDSFSEARSLPAAPSPAHLQSSSSLREARASERREDLPEPP